MITLDIATAQSANRKLWKNVKCSWSDLCTKLAEPQVTHETYSEYMSMTKSEQGTIKDVGGFVGGYLSNGRRKPEAVLHRQLFTLDIDFAGSDFVNMFSFYMDGIACVIHSTHKHSSSSPRYRVIIPLSREVIYDEYMAAARMFAANFNINIFDPTTFQPERLMFWPSHSKDAEWIYTEIQGDPLDVDSLLKQYVDWKNIAEWPFAEAVSKPLALSDKNVQQENPEEKPGIVGIFCRAYSIEEAIEKFLPDEYVKSQLKGRYTYLKGTTAGGMIIYDNLWAYSYHSSDPTCNKLCNAFDLIRLHKFGHLDPGNVSDLRFNAVPSYKAMVEWCRKLKEFVAQSTQEKIDKAKFNSILSVPHIVKEQQYTDKQTERAADQKEEEASWKTLFDIDAKGMIASSAYNISLVFKYDETLSGKFAYNAFDNKRYLMQSVLWRDINKPEPIRDVDFSGIRNYLEITYGIVAAKKIDDSIALAFNYCQFNPVKDYLDSLEWDEIDRIPEVLIDLFGVTDSPYSREVLLRWMMAAVARIYNPGTKFDEMLVLVGPQGCGKSTFFKMLGRDWYSDTFTTVQGKEAYEQIQGAWIMEVPELTAFRKADANSIKHFIAKCVDSFRPAYGRTMEDFPRQTVFGGTTNQEDFLNDPTGNRRFWPVKIYTDRSKYTVWSEKFKDMIDDLWAEATAKYKGGGSLLLNPAANTEAEKVRDGHRVSDERAGLIENFLDTLLPTDWQDRDIEERRAWLRIAADKRNGKVLRDEVCVFEIWCELFGRNKDELNTYQSKDINNMIRDSKKWEPASGTKKFPLYGKQRYYKRVESENNLLF